MAEQIIIGKGDRKNDNKVRFDLLEPFAQLQKAQIFTKGMKKYAANNWLQGMSWSKCYASALRHQAAWARGEDFDSDPDCLQCQESKRTGIWSCTNHTGELHSALAAWNWDAITSYYKHYPQGDDRLHMILPKPKIALDIDEVIAGFVPAWCKKWKLETPDSWYFDNMTEKFDAMSKEGSLDEFYLKEIQPLCKPEDIPFEPHCYITSRPIESDVTERWLKYHGFPKRPVITVPSNTSKVEVFKKSGANILIDDKYETFDEFSRNNLCCFLFDAPHNQRYEVGYRRLKSLKDIFKFTT